MKGMQKIKRGSGFGGLLKYALAHDKAEEPGRIIGGTMNGFDVKSLTAEFAQVRALRPDIGKPVWHNSLRLPEGDPCSDMQWQEIAEDYMTRMGYDVKKAQYLVVKHDDENGVHIIANRIQKDGSMYLGRNENLASTRIISELEKAHKLRQTKGLEYDENNRIKSGYSNAGRLSAAEKQKAKRTGIDAPKQHAQNAIKQALAEGPCSAPEFAERVARHGIQVQASVSGGDTRKMNGFSFSVEDASNTKRNTVVFKGSQLGYSWSVLQKAGVTYDKEKDYRRLACLSTSDEVKQYLDTVTVEKQQQWDQQHAALDADAYIVHCESTDAAPAEFRIDPTPYTAAEVRDAVAELEGLEDKGYNIKIEPVSKRWHYLPVSDLKPNSFRAMTSAGYTPTVAMPISHGSCDALIRIPKQERAADDAAAAQAALTLQKQYGKGSPTRKVPLAGFKVDGFVSKIVSSAKNACKKAAELAAQLRDHIIGPAAPAAPPTPAEKLADVGLDGVSNEDLKAIEESQQGFAAQGEAPTTVVKEKSMRSAFAAWSKEEKAKKQADVQQPKGNDDFTNGM